jgi:colanic acid/amylovoran biosynthesis glycosyltransferase
MTAAWAPTGAGASDSSARTSEQQPRVAYVMSRFPKLTETFILFEILAHEADGMSIEIYPLLRERAPVMHREAERLVRRAHYQPMISRAIIGSQIHHLRHRPRAYLRALGDVVRETWGSLNFLIGGLAIFPKVAHMARLMAHDGVTHVHCHFANHPALAGFVIHRLSGIPYSFTAHGSDLHVDRHMLCAKVAEAAFVVPISEFNRRVITDECGDASGANLVVIHTGVETEHFRPRAGEAPDDVFRIVCVGTLHEVKGQRYLVEACRRMLDAGIPFECRFIGDGPDRDMLASLAAERGLEHHIILDGELDRAQLGARLSAAHVLVAPSVPTAQGKREGIPVVLMEAMSSGIPVVASRLSGIPELVMDSRSGLLVEPGDVEGLAGALRRLHADPELRRRLAAEGRRTVERDFDIRRNAARLAAMFRGGAAGPLHRSDSRVAPPHADAQPTSTVHS